MSRARPFDHNGERIWFDQKARATVRQLELLSDYEDVSIDDLLDADLTQKQVLFRLRIAQDDGVIPPEVLERRRQRLLEQGRAPACRICTMYGLECEGRITRHHFVPRWLMRELENYGAYSSRSICTIPICVGRHRDLHFRDDEAPKSIAPYLRVHERKLAQRMLDDLREQHPKVFDLMAAGEHTYEYQLVRDYMTGEFVRAEGAYEFPEFDTNAVASAAQ